MELDLIGKNSWYQIVAINFTLFLKPFGPKRQKKNALYLSVNVFSTKVLIGTLYFTSPNGDGTAILRDHPSHAKVQPPAGQRKYLHFLVIFKNLSIGPAPGIEPPTSRSAVKRSTDWSRRLIVKFKTHKTLKAAIPCLAARSRLGKIW